MMAENPFRTELAEALLADVTERPQRCGHSSDPMCCPFENLPLLAAWFTQATRLGPDTKQLARRP